MDIIPCPDCGRIVSSDAITCPMCGFRLMQPLPPKQEPAPAAQEDFRRAAYGVLLLLAMCALIAAAFIILHTDRVSPPQPVGKTRQNNLPSQTGPETLLAQTRPVPREEIPTEEIEKPAKEHLRLPEKTGAAPEPDEQTDRPLPEKKRPLTPEEKKIATLLHGVKSEFNAGLWETAIRDCRELLGLLEKDESQAAEIERLLYLAEIELQTASSTGIPKNILSGLSWLARHQDPDGRWDQDGFKKNCLGSDKCNGCGTSQYDVAVTSLALLSFLKNGHTHETGLFSQTVANGLNWLAGSQMEDGSLGPREVESWIYNHSIGTLALCEAYALTKDAHLKEPAQKAVDFIASAQNPGLGWKYEPQSGRSDTSVTGWMVLALKAARTAGLEVDLSAFDGAINWLDRATNTAGKCGYMRPGDDGSVIRKVNEHFAKMPTMTAVAVVCRIACGQSRRFSKPLKGIDILMANLPDWNRPKNDRVDMYYWYYGTRALSLYGEESWYKWRTAAAKALLDNQRSGGCADGSWDPAGKWAIVGGRVYSTAICVLTLQVIESGRPPRGEPPRRRPARKRKASLTKYIDSTVRVSLRNGESFEGKLSYADDDLIILKMRDNSLRELKREDIESMRLIH